MKTRSISRRILYHDLTLILLPVLLILLIGGSLYSAFILLSDNSSMLSELLMSQTSSYGPSLVVKNLRDDLEQSTSAEDFHHRFQPLVELGFVCHIYKNDTLYYVSEHTSISDNIDKIKKIGYIPSSREPFQLWNEKGFAYHSVLIQDNNEYSLWVCSDDVRWSIANDMQWKSFKEDIKIMIIIISTLLITILISVGFFLSRRLSHSMIKPLKKLHQATQEIGLHHLENPYTIQGEGEILELSQSFEEMRVQLLEHEKLQAEYEQNRIELLSRIAHDLNTPLTIIHGYINSLLDGLYQDASKQEEILQTLLSQSDKMHQLIQDLFLYSTLSLDKEVYDDVTFNVVEFIQEWLFDKKFYFQSQKIHIKFDYDEDFIYICVDPKHLTRIFDNLISNSDKYRKDEYVNVLISLYCVNHQVIFTFSDDGIGVQDHELDDLFVSFYRGDKARSSTIKGHGLGLSIVNELMKHYNGNIHAQRVEPHGLKIVWHLERKENFHETYSNY